MSELKFIGFLADIFGKKDTEITLDRPTKLRDGLGIPFPEERAIVLINQRQGDYDSLIENQDKVVIMPMISGG